MTGQPTLRTERLALVPLADEHLELEVELDSDAEVMRYLTGRASTRAEVEAAHGRRMASAREVDGLGFWMGFAGPEFVGWWLLRPPNGPDQPKVPNTAELGYRLLRRHWRRGYASEGAAEMIRYGFADVGLDRILAQTMTVNAGSRATMRNVGFRYVRTFISADEDGQATPDTEHGEVEYALTRAEWSAAAPG